MDELYQKITDATQTDVVKVVSDLSIEQLTEMIQVEDDGGMPLISRILEEYPLEVTLGIAAAVKDDAVKFKLLFDKTLDGFHPIERAFKHGLKGVFSVIIDIYDRKFSMMFKIDDHSGDCRNLLDFITRRSDTVEQFDELLEDNGVDVDEFDYDGYFKMIEESKRCGVFRDFS